jgi:hypothetical protein
MQRLILVTGFFLLLVGLAVAQQPVVPAPMTPIAQWPSAIPASSPAPADQAAGQTGVNQGGAYVFPIAVPIAGQPTATTPPEPNVNTSLSQAQIIGTDNFGGVDSVYRTSFSSSEVNLADAAREARQRMAKDRPRVFTNDDIARLRRDAGEPPLAAPGARPVTSEETMPASDVTAPGRKATTPGNRPNAAQNPDGAQNNLPASDQTTTPPANQDNQNPAKHSPFQPKQ